MILGVHLKIISGIRVTGDPTSGASTFHQVDNPNANVTPGPNHADCRHLSNGVAVCKSGGRSIANLDYVH